MAELRQFDLNLLVAFDLLMKERSVSRAAEKMFISQSAMSHILQRLRQQLDDPLLLKTPAGMAPTERALALVETYTRGGHVAAEGGAPWRCPHCQELHESQFSDCWKCGAARAATPSGAPR